MITGKTDIREAYRDERVAREYIDQRFREPIGALLHDRQAAMVKRLVGTLQPSAILEIAPGPARLTVELASVFRGNGVVLDASAQMLGLARERMAASGHRTWGYVHGDAFQLPFNKCFDLVVMFRLIRHFDETARTRLYAEIKRVLHPRGVLVFDAVNRRAQAAFRARYPEQFTHFDALLMPDEIRDELSRSGFGEIQLAGVQQRYALLHRLQVLVAPRSRALARAAMEVVDRAGGGEPSEWVVTCRPE